jgi:hypothetical protein
MGIDLDAAAAFMATHARQLDRHRFDLVLGRGDGDGALAALDAYRNGDGGYGRGLEPDLRSLESQPAAALHAFEAIADLGPRTTPRSVELCDWLGSISLPDGGLPFARPVTSTAGCAPFWVDADSTVSSLQITAIVAANAHRVARFDAEVARHPWLGAATRYCVDAIAALDEAPHALVLAFSVQFLDAAHDAVPEAHALVGRLARLLPADGRVHVDGGAPDEFVRPLDFAPETGGPGRSMFAPAVVEADLARLASLQQSDGGWPLEWAAYSPAAALEWRGYLTVRAVSILSRRAGSRSAASS